MLSYKFIDYLLAWVKNILEANQCGFGSETLLFSVLMCGFAICGLIFTNLRICGLRIGTPKKFVDLRLQNEPKNLRICDLRTKQKKLRVHLCPRYYSIPNLFVTKLLTVVSMTYKYLIVT
jgi:hypothetical protein